MHGLCLILYPNPKETKKNQETLRNEVDWWAASVKLLGNPKLLDELQNFDKDNCEEAMINRVGKFIKDPENEKFLDLKVV